MSSRIRRDGNGQFAQGQSGNPEGARLRQPKELLTVDDLYRIQLDVASEVIGQANSKPVTRFENAVRMLAKGSAGNRLATRDFIDLTRNAAYYFKHKGRSDALNPERK